MVLSPEMLQTIKYMTNTQSEPTDVVISLPLWKTLLAMWQQAIESLEEQEDFALLVEWLQKRLQGELKMIPLMVESFSKEQQNDQNQTTCPLPSH